MLYQLAALFQKQMRSDTWTLDFLYLHIFFYFSSQKVAKLKISFLVNVVKCSFVCACLFSVLNFCLYNVLNLTYFYTAEHILFLKFSLGQLAALKIGFCNSVYFMLYYGIIFDVCFQIFSYFVLVNADMSSTLLFLGIFKNIMRKEVWENLTVTGHIEDKWDRA